MPNVEGFAPSTTAPLFANGGPGNPWPAAVWNLEIDYFPPLPPITVSASTWSFCGGMSFLTRDIFEAKTAQLRGTSTPDIPVGLAQLLMNRQLDSIGGEAGATHWVALTQMLDHDTALGGLGLYGLTVDQCKLIVAQIDAGILCPIGLVLAQAPPFPLVGAVAAAAVVFNNHVELAYGYSLTGSFDAGGELVLQVYDCNYPNRDDRTITVPINPSSASAPAQTILTNATPATGEGSAATIRGLFTLNSYSHKDPSPAYIDDASMAWDQPTGVPTLANPGQHLHLSISVTNTGSTTWDPARGFSLGSQDPQDNTAWGVSRVAVPYSVDPGSVPVTFNFDITAPSTPGSYGCQWRMVHENVDWFGDSTQPVTVGVGLSSADCAKLDQQLNAVKQAIAKAQSELATAINPEMKNAILAQINSFGALVKSLQQQKSALKCP